ncbi:MAG TPA: 16S rRNA (cytosine(1402)-N(4))-methyltransferase RsmH [Puia sp.]|nr:16S rRNA (cytosine(1402)-N(4))-methyltransferase RsmH [Puia sp.]
MGNKEHSPLPFSNNEDYHVPVLLNETLEGLQIKPDGIYVDCTLGGGGHASGVLKRLDERGKLFAFDQDPDAKRNLPDDKRVVFVPQNFRHAQRFLRLHKITTVDGITADLGVSSHQFDEAERGFSFRFDGALDMRMNNQQTLTAADVINSYDEKRLHKIFEQYGEVTNSKTLAGKIVEQRKKLTFTTIRSFTNLISTVVKGNPNKYFAQVFQSLRIEVNDELNALKDMLSQSPSLLNTGGRIAVITFHSLEDRIVKNFFKNGTTEQNREDHDPFGQTEKPPLKIVTKKPIVPTEKEMNENPRSRSAKLRIAEKR